MSARASSRRSRRTGMGRRPADRRSLPSIARRPTTAFAATLLLLGPSLVAPLPARGQEVAPAVVGGVTGLAAGTFVSVALVTLQARRGDYMMAARDALGWEIAPIIVGAGVGVALGTNGWDELGRAGLGGLAFGLAGAAAGWAFGASRWDPPEGAWAGGVIGGAAGLALGILTTAVFAASDDEVPDGRPKAAFQIQIPTP